MLRHHTWLMGLAVFLVSGPWCLAQDTTMGNWEGTYETNDGDTGDVKAQIIARGEGNYEGHFLLPKDDGSESKLPFRGKKQGEEVHITGKVDLGSENGGAISWTGTVTGGEFYGTYTGSDSNGSFTLRRVQKTPPSLGAEPPENAKVLFDGTSLDHWQLPNGDPVPWELTDEGTMRVARKQVEDRVLRGNIVSKDKFTDMVVHLEFRTPFMPKARGQGRGNSGVYLQGLYEVQVLDSFGEEPKDNEAGGIYQVAVPRVNASLPPGEWQTYDITFRAPKFEGKEVTEPGQITVVHNGITIHDKVQLKFPTAGSMNNDPTQPGPIMLQDHSNPVEYRNVWVLPLGDKE